MNTNSIDIRNFVDINIINKKTVAKNKTTRDVVALFTTESGYTGDIYSDITSISTTNTKKYAEIYFNNGGVSLRIETYTATSDLLTKVKALSNDIIVVAVVSDKATIDIVKTLATSYNTSSVYGVNEKIFLATTTVSDATDYSAVKNLAVKLNTVGNEMTIAAYLSQVDVSKENNIKDYAFTQEVITDETEYTDENVKTAISKHYNISVNINGITRNIGGDLTTGEDLINKYTLIILHQTLSNAIFTVLSQKLKNQEAINTIYTVMSEELNKYVYNGYLQTDKVWTNDDLTVVKNNVKYTLIEKGTALNKGYKIKILPFNSLIDTEKKAHKLPYIYVVLADAYDIRQITIEGEVI